MDKNNIKIGIIGLGCRGISMLESCLIERDHLTFTAVCDVYEDRMEQAADIIEKARGTRPLMFADYHDMLKAGIDAIMIFSAWETHIPVSVAAMKAGVAVACEVGGAYTLDQCYELVKVYEETKTPIMLLENCCYGRTELMVWNMVKKGLFGDVIHCEGGYRHYLADEITRGEENRHYRLRNYMNRNCENYPTHELGPIAKILNINRGNRMVALTSTASRQQGLNEFAAFDKGADHPLASYPFAQGDVVTTVIKCAHGETITLFLDTSLPRYYTRNFNIHGTKALYTEDNRSFFFFGNERHEKNHFNWEKEWGNEKEYRDEHEHPIWKQFLEDGVQGGHDGMDWLELNAFFDALVNGKEMPIDVYDMASWMAITCLSEESIANGSAPVAIPDFTNGMWTMRKPQDCF